MNPSNNLPPEGEIINRVLKLAKGNLLHSQEASSQKDEAATSENLISQLSQIES